MSLVIMVALWNRADHYIFAVWFLLSSFFSSPSLSGRRLDVYHTSTHGATLVQIENAGLKRAACSSLKIQDAKKLSKIAIWAPSHDFVGLYLHNYGTYRQSKKKRIKQHYLLHMFPQYGELRPISGWDRFVSLEHPRYFQRVSRFGSITARQSSSGRQPDFAVLNRGRHLCLARRPSRWALAHILVVIDVSAGNGNWRAQAWW